jgi:hypothetical protein
MKTTSLSRAEFIRLVNEEYPDDLASFAMSGFRTLSAGLMEIGSVYYLKMLRKPSMEQLATHYQRDMERGVFL